MDADWDAVDGDSGGDDGDESDGGGAVGLGKLNCNYAGYRYGLSRGWYAGWWNRYCKLDGVYYGCGAGCAERDDFVHDYEWGLEYGAGSECGIDTDGDVLHGGVSPG